MREAGVVSPSFMLLNRAMDLGELVDTPGPEWESIYCASKKAYGCGEHGQKLVEGLALYVRRHELPDLNASLSIRLSDKALRSIQAEFGVPGSRAVEAEGAVKVVSQQFLVLLVMFRISLLERLVYYLVFDSTNASLCIVPKLPSDLRTSYTLTAVPVRSVDGKDHELVLMARHTWKLSLLGHVRLCVCTHTTSVSSVLYGASPWKVTEDRRLPQVSRTFSANLMFSCQGKAFWADLSQGVLYCDLRDKDGVLKLNFIRLPKACRFHFSEANRGEQKQPHKSRTMGCAGDSIKFISIERSHPQPGNEMLKVWTLDLDHRRWKESKGIPWKKLCKKVGFVQAELEDIVPQCPTLMEDGTLCLLLGKKAESLEGSVSMCRFDIGSKSLVSAGRVVDYDTFQPVVVPYNFFTMCNPPSRKRKLPKHARELSMPKRKLQKHAREPKKKLPTHKMKLPTIMKEKLKRSALAIQ